MATTSTAQGTQGLLQEIAAQAPNSTVQAAMLVGSYGESNWDPNAVGSGGYGAFGFTSSNYTVPGGSNYIAPGSAPAQQVATMLPQYVAAAASVPKNLTGPAQAEWIALEAERPLNYQAEQQVIEQTNLPTTYGANVSYSVQNWSTIQGIMSGNPAQGNSTAAGSSSSNSSTAATTTSGSVLGACDSSKSALSIPLLGFASSIPVIGGLISKVTTVSILNQCQAKSLISAGIVLGGGLVMLVGVAILASGSSTGKKLIAIAPVGYAAEQLGKIAGSRGGNSEEVVSGPATLPPLGSSSKRTHSGYRMNAGDKYDDSGEF